MSIQFDSTELENATYIPQYVKHETVSERLLTSLPLARQDGEILIADKRGKKIIQLKGTLIAANRSALDTAIDTFNELMSRQAKNLDITFEGGTRRYVATCISHEYDRDHYNTNAVPWTAEFIILSGEGKATSVTTALSAASLSFTGSEVDDFAMLGSKPAKPVITLNVDGVGSAVKGVEYKNTDNGEKIQITRGNATWGGGSGKNIIIDCLNRKVTDNIGASTYREGIFYGSFPSFKIGTNNVQITLGALVAQASGDPDDLSKIVTGLVTGTTDTRLAQGFSVPYRDSTFSAIKLAIRKLGTPGTLTIRIETDDDGQPSGTLVDANATVNVAHGSLTTGYQYYQANFAGLFTLEANTKYWIVIKAAATVDGSNYYEWGLATDSAYFYPRGASVTSVDAGVTYSTSSDFFGFRLLYGGTSPSSTLLHTVEYTKTYL